MPTVDAFDRPLRNLRLSVTDRCNLRCSYCMPEDEYVWLPKDKILSFEELARVVDVFLSLGVDRVRLTGGEPLLRRGLPELVRQIASKPGVTDVAMTTNGIRLADHAEALARAGLSRVTVSLDTLREDRFRALTRRDELPQVLAGIEAARTAGFAGSKLDTVVMRGVNDDELVPLLEYAKTVGYEVRFIEYMDVGGATRWSMADVVSREEMLATLSGHYGPIERVVEDSSAPADRYALPDGTVFGIISSTTAPFCSTCDRSRLTADGMWYLCLYAKLGLDLRAPLRGGATIEELAALLKRTWSGRTDRGAEERLAMHDRTALAQRDELRANPHLEMHKRGG
ncbi:MAG: GTP 3',8-cyclase MoaA [Planctomycetota bacterium]|nr:MAG: GTP 3',8-cyclase MoaA [Planctomycetota bacterium]